MRDQTIEIDILNFITSNTLQIIKSAPGKMKEMESVREG